MTFTRLWSRGARLAVLLALVLGTLTLTAFASDVEWTYDSGTLTVTGTDFVPDYFAGEDWSEHISEIQRIVLSEGITGIGQSAFEGCTALTEVQLPETMEYIGAYCFSECPNLTEITFPASVTDIEDSAFYCEDGSGLLTVIFHGTPYYISDYAFETVTARAYYYEECDWDESNMLDYSGTLTWLPVVASGTCGENATWILAGNTLTISGTGAMADYADWNSTPWSEYIDSITQVIIEEGITGIGNFAFHNMTGLNQVSLPESLGYIGSAAFYDCSNLTEISLPSNLVTISDQAFYHTGLTSIVIPDSVYQIAEYAFSKCADLRVVTLSDNMQIIPESCFSECFSLESIHIPASVMTVELGAFSACDSLANIYIEDLEKWCQIDFIAFTPAPYTLHLNGESVTDLVIPESITSIPDHAFQGCTSIKSLDLVNVDYIYPYAFSGCTSLETVSFPNKLHFLHQECFAGCTALKAFHIPGSVGYIDNGVFSGSGLTELYFYGNHPTFAFNALYQLENLKIYYPENDSSWTYAINQPYGSRNSEWIPHTVVCPHENIVTDAAVPATCTEPGLTEGSHCADCEEILVPQKPVPATDHIPGELTGKIDPSCSKEGYTGDVYCTVCETPVTEGEIIPALDHISGELIGKLDPTCTEDGYTGDTYCTVCESPVTEGKAIPATGHTKVIHNKITPTCVSQGYTGDEVCQFCNDYVVPGELLPMTDHTWSQWITVHPTFTHSGFGQRKCTACGKVEEKSIPKLEPENPFEDVKSDTWYYDSVLWAARTGITTGTDDTHFTPEAVCTRGQVVTFLWRALTEQNKSNGANPFTDVAKTDFFYDAVLWAEKNDITEGTSSTTFSPEASCTRAQVVTFLWRASGCPAPSTKATFTDVPTDTWYSDAVLWAKESNITDGTGNGLFSPDAECTRAQIVTFLYRWIATETIA